MFGVWCSVFGIRSNPNRTPNTEHRTPIPLCSLLFALTLLTAGSAVGQSVTLRSDLINARAALSAGQPDVAAALARRALDRDPGDQDAAVLLGLSLEAQGRRPEAVTVLAATARQGSTGQAAFPEPARIALARLLPGAFPDPLAADLQATLPGAGAVQTVGTVSFRVIAPGGMLPTPVTDPKYAWKFSCRAVVYIGPARRYSVYYQQVQDQELAAKVAELLGRLHGAAALLGPLSPTGEVRVWLPRAGQAGGEQFRDSIYLFAAQVARSDGEWVREVAHELGHVLLPSFARYEAPEPMENGYLGERLLPKWLSDLGERAVWDGRVSLAEYVRDRVAPLRSRFLDAGPASSLRADRGAAGMDYAIGMILALEAQHGPAFLSRVFAHAAGTGLESLLLAYRDEVALLKEYTIRVELVVPRRSVTSGKVQGRLRFRRAAYRAYLPSGRWQIIPRGAQLEGLKLRVDGRPVAASGSKGEPLRFLLSTDVSRWHLLQLEASRPGAALAEITLRRVPPPPRTQERTGRGANLRRQ